MKNTRVEELIAAYLSGNIRAGEKEELMTWVGDESENRTFFDKAVDLWSLSDKYSYPDFSAGKEKAWNRLDDRLFGEQVTKQPQKGRLRVMRSRKWAVAAAISLLLAAGMWWWMGRETYSTLMAQTTADERLEVALPDGSSVWLNEASNLSYHEDGRERVVTLTGEGFFDVATDSLRPFRIIAGESVTTVLGTSFNVRAYPEEEVVEVSVTEGKVTLEKREDQAIKTERVELEAGDTGIFTPATEEVKAAEKPTVNTTAWKDRKLVFDGVPMGSVIESLERYFSIEVEVKDASILQCELQSEFSEPKLNEIIELFEFNLIEVEQDNGKLTLSGTPLCQ